jgi:anti-anti-sigma factor
MKPSVSQLEVTTERLASMTVVHAAGYVDGSTAASLQGPLLAAAENARGSVRLDLARVPYMSSAGLRVLLLAAKALQLRGERLQLAHVLPHIQNVLSVSGFTSFIDIVP